MTLIKMHANNIITLMIVPLNRFLTLSKPVIFNSAYRFSMDMQNRSWEMGQKSIFQIFYYIYIAAKSLSFFLIKYAWLLVRYAFIHNLKFHLGHGVEFQKALAYIYRTSQRVAISGNTCIWILYPWLKIIEKTLKLILLNRKLQGFEYEILIFSF